MVELKSPVQKLRLAQDAPIEQFCVLTSVEEIDELREYVKEIAYDPTSIKDRIKKLLLLYVAAVRFMVLSFDNDEYPKDIGLLVHCDNLAKTLYTIYKEVDIILITREIEASWKCYLKLIEMSGKLSDSSFRKLEAKRDRILFRLSQICHRIKTL